MTITPEMKKAFRAAYDALEMAPELPENPGEYSEFFSEVGGWMRSKVNDNRDNELMHKLLLAVYNYLEAEYDKRKQDSKKIF